MKSEKSEQSFGLYFFIFFGYVKERVLGYNKQNWYKNVHNNFHIVKYSGQVGDPTDQKHNHYFSMIL